MFVDTPVPVFTVVLASTEASLKQKFNRVVSCLLLLVTFSRKSTNESTIES